MQYDCQKCGACCTFFHKGELKENNYPLWAVPINPDYQNVPPAFVQIGKKLTIADSDKEADANNFYTTNQFVKNNNTRCSALSGEVGSSVSCLIYENRPPVCRKFEAGSDRCKIARKAEIA